MQHTRSHKFVKVVTAALAVAFLAVPVAQARLAVDARHAALLNKEVVQEPVLRTDARHAALLNKAETDRVVVVQGPTVPKITQMHRRLAILDLPRSDVSTTVSAGFDWRDAGVGAGVAFALVLAATGAMLVTRRKLVGA
jgi:hypothetical protein